jgi:hypothetical protein
MIEEITVLLNSRDYDIRKSKDARFMDQKVTPDVLSIVSDCVANFVADRNIEFTKDDIWNDNYFNKNVKGIFNKPDVQNETTKLEYDKFTSQPLRTLTYAGILSLRKDGIKNVYKIENQAILEFIGLRERNAYLFLYFYLTKVLSDSNFLRHFNEFKRLCEIEKVSKENFQELKIKFQRFIIGNTAINGVIEVNRIFPKILNIYSCENGIRGAIKGTLSKRVIYYTDLMYNRPNWRDIDKNKNVSRHEAIVEHENLMIDQNEAYSDYQVQKALNLIRKMYTESEVKDQWSNGEATQVHHIFPRSSFPHLAHYLENLIKLTPTQHNTKAHPRNYTQHLNKDYQLICIMAKSDSIEQSLKRGEFFYSKESFIFVINSGLSIDLKYDLDFISIKREIAKIYNYN